MVRHTPGDKALTACCPSRDRQISPWPSRTYQISSTVRCRTARDTCAANSRKCAMPPPAKTGNRRTCDPSGASKSWSAGSFMSENTSATFRRTALHWPLGCCTTGSFGTTGVGLLSACCLPCRIPARIACTISRERMGGDMSESSSASTEFNIKHASALPCSQLRRSVCRNSGGCAGSHPVNTKTPVRMPQAALKRALIGFSNFRWTA